MTQRNYWFEVLAVLPVLAAAAISPAWGAEIVAGCQIPNAAIATEKSTGPGSMLYLYVLSSDPQPVSVQNVAWDGSDISRRQKAPGYEVVWWRVRPGNLERGREAEISISLRNEIKTPADFTVTFSNGKTSEFRLSPEPPPFRFGTIAFDKDLRKAFCYVESLAGEGPVPEQVYVDGALLKGAQIKWLSQGYVAGVRACVITPAKPFERGRFYTFRLASGKSTAGAALRAFSDLARFGTAGYQELQRFASGGLNHYYSFHQLPASSFDLAQKLGLKITMVVPPETAPPKETIGHPALYGYAIWDEPDCQDYGADKTRPEHLRVGTVAPRMVRSCELVTESAPLVPAMFTLNLTFVPQNYYIYGQIPDILLPDSYPITHGRSVMAMRDHAALAKQATAPRPFLMVYQGCWEEYAFPGDKWAGRDDIKRGGWRKYVDTGRIRGFGRAPTPAEVKIETLYAVGCGAKGGISYTDATESCQNLVFHGSADLPEVWHMIGAMSRTLRVVAPLIEVAHPVVWVSSDGEKLWIRTLLAGDAAVLVVVVNEDYQSAREAFTQNPATNVKLSFPNLPWLKAKAVWRVEDGKLAALEVKESADGVSWTEKIIADGSLYLVVSDQALAGNLLARARSERPVATEAGRKLAPESYLKGRRLTNEK